MAEQSNEPVTKKQKTADTPRRVNRFVYRELTTTDVESVKKFYTGLLGWDFRLKKFEHFDYHTIFLSEGSDYQIGGMMHSKEAPPAWNNYISVDSIDPAVAKIKEYGGEIVHGPFPCDYGKIAICKDTTGAYFSAIELAPATPVPDTVSPLHSFCWTQLMTSDVDKSLKFYESLVHWKAKNSHGNVILTYEDADHDCSVMKKPDEHMPDHWLSYVLVAKDALEGKTSEAEKLGGNVIVPPTPLPGIGKFSIISDPTGGIFALWEIAHNPPQSRFNVVTLLVNNQDEAKAWFEKHLGFVVAKDNSFGDMRWITLKAPGDDLLELTLCLAKTEEDKQCVGRQTGSYPLFVVAVPNIADLYDAMKTAGVHFYEEPQKRPYGTEVTFKDLYGNRWSLLQPSEHHGRSPQINNV